MWRERRVSCSGLRGGLWMGLSWTDYTPNRLGCDGGQQKNDGIDGMPVTKRGVRDVVQKRKNDRIRCERKSVFAAPSNENGDAGERSHSGKNGAEHQGANQPGVRRQKVLQGIGKASPKRGEAVAEQNQIRARMGDDEAHRFASLFLHERGFAQAEIAQRLTLLSDVSWKARMLVVVVFVIVVVKINRDIRTQWDKPV